MANRRQFVQSGLALSAVASVRAGALPGEARAADVASLRLDRFIYDNRFAESVEIALYAGREGVPLWETSGDMTDLWIDYLAPKWSRQPAALAGVTTRDGLFVIETLAADHRMRVVYRGEHGAPQDGSVAHALSGPQAVISEAKFESHPSLWAPLLARAMVRYPIGATAAVVNRLATPASHPSRDQPLFSWIIAPRSAVALTV
jgi:hypothetical protein